MSQANERLVSRLTTITILAPEDVTDEEVERAIYKRIDSLPWAAAMTNIVREGPRCP